jgi:hypothetical protein
MQISELHCIQKDVSASQFTWSCFRRLPSFLDMPMTSRTGVLGKALQANLCSNSKGCAKEIIAEMKEPLKMPIAYVCTSAFSS